MLSRLSAALLATALILCVTPGYSAGERPQLLLLEDFADDPIVRADSVLRGEFHPRLEWNDDAPAFPGDRPGSITALYDATLPTGFFGRPLSRPLTQDDSFVAAFSYSIRSEGFFADPNGFAQISFGLWNSATTGLERTGTPTDFVTDSYDLVSMDWFPNESPFLGGPFVSPGLFGQANVDAPDFPFSGAFANAAFYFGPPASLPLDTPLVTLIVHDSSRGSIVFETFVVTAANRFERIEPASATVERADLSLNAFVVDSAGPTMWRDGFSGSVPSLHAEVDFHGMAVAVGDELSGMLASLLPGTFGSPDRP